MRVDTRVQLNELVMLVVATLAGGTLVQAQPYDLSWNTVDGGGAMYSTGGAYSLGGTIGQPDAGVMTGGFWAGASATTGVTIASSNPPADNPYVAGNQPFVDVLDTGANNVLTAGIGGAGTAPQGPYTYSPISVTFSQPPAPQPALGNVTIACTGGACPSIIGVSRSGAGPYDITLSSPIPPGQCTTLTFAGAPGVKLQYRSQPGNVNMDALTNTQDMLAVIQALNNGQANQLANLARYNVNRSTGASPVNTQDLLRVIQLLNGTNTTQVFNGTTVANCP